MFFHPKNLKSENDNPWFTWFNILLYTQAIMCDTVISQCLEYLGCMTLPKNLKSERHNPGFRL